MNLKPLAIALLMVVALQLLVTCDFCRSQEYRHEHIHTIQDAQLSRIVHIEATVDGRMIYALGYRPGYIVWFNCDPETGRLSKVGAFNESQVVSLDISEDQKWLVACCTGGKVMLFRRDQETGNIDLAHQLEQSTVPQLTSTFGVKFSPDAKFVYVACRSDRLIVLAVNNEKLQLLQQQNGADKCLDRCEAVARTPSGGLVFVSSAEAGTISVFQPEEDGRLRLLNYVSDDSLQAALLKGIHGITVSPDGKNVYATSGRFSGDNAVSGFLIRDDFTLEKVSEFEDGVELDGFQGGHYLKVSPDGKFLYATAAKSGKIACFRREAETGRLEFQEYLSIQGNDKFGLPSGISFSADGEFVYVGVESHSRLMAFRRVPVKE